MSVNATQTAGVLKGTSKTAADSQSGVASVAQTTAGAGNEVASAPAASSVAKAHKDAAKRSERADRDAGKAAKAKAREKREKAKALASISNDRLTVKDRLLTVANILFVAFLAVQALPNRTSVDPQALYSIVVVTAVWAVSFVVCLVTKSRTTRDSTSDVVAVVIVAILAWVLATAKLNVVPQKMFPAPGIVFAQMVADWAKILTGIASSLGIIAEGFLTGGACAIVLGLFLGYRARRARSADKVVAFLSAIPPVVYIPYGIALLPTFRAASVLVIFLASFWPTLTGTLAGVRSVDQRILDSARVLNVSGPKALFKVVLPGSLPLIFNGLNIGLCLAFILLTSAEMIGGSSGMGYYVKYYSDFGDYTRVLAGIIVIGIVITAVSLVLNKILKRITRWQ